MNRPEYVFKGRTYKTINGLSKAIFQDSGCDSHSMVVNRVITATVGRKPNERIVARYTVSPPVLGQPMTVTRQSEIPAANLSNAYKPNETEREQSERQADRIEMFRREI